MPDLKAHLFGKFYLQNGRANVEGLDAGRIQELLAYLLLHHDHPVARESLAELLWSDSPPTVARKYLRQTLWQLQLVLDSGGQRRDSPILLVETNWISVNTQADLWVDVRVFEEAATASTRVAGNQLTAEQAGALEAATQLYQGDLLEGWYQDWCLFERERLQLLYLSMLDKLIAHSEAQQAYEEAVVFGERILRCDRAHENAHRRLMRLHYLSGNRTGALRQYDRCVAALAHELDAAPSAETQTLRDRIKSGEVPAWTGMQTSSTLAHDVLGSLKQVVATLSDLRRLLEVEIRILERPAESDR